MGLREKEEKVEKILKNPVVVGSLKRCADEACTAQLSE